MTARGPERQGVLPLSPFRRNRYFFGKLLTADNLLLEQEFTRSGQTLLNRVVLGAGVLAGLDVRAVLQDGTWGIEVAAGVAINRLGQQIVVHHDVALVPPALTDHCGVPLSPPSPLPDQFTVAVCYRECETDFSPVLVGDPSCGGDERCEAGTVVETYALRVLEGHAPPAGPACAVETLAAIRAGDLQRAMCTLVSDAVGSPTGADDCCVALANVTVAADGSLVVEQCAPRQLVPTNQLLLGLIACLAEWVEECCGRVEPTPTPTPVPLPTPTPMPTPTPTPTPAPTPDQLLKIGGIRLLQTGGDPANPLPEVLAVMPRPQASMQLHAVPDAIEVTFANAPLDPSSVQAGTTFVVQGGPPGLPPPQIVHLPGNIVRYSVQPSFAPGVYRVRLAGDPTPQGLAITSQAGRRLDGERTAAWPTGDDVEGGDYAFRLNIAP